MTPKKKEKRGHKRYSVEGVHGNVLHPSDLEILNMSIDGAAIETSKRLDINREYTFKIKHKGDIVSFRGCVIWSLLTNKEIRDTNKIIPVYRAGIRFTDMLNERGSQLIDFIEESKITTLERRVVGVRFKIAAPRNIKIEYPYKYEVKKMSVSGMLVETGYPLKVNSRYHIEIFLEKNILELIGRVAYCEEVNPGNDDKKYNIGIEFTKMTDEKRDLIKKFLKNW
jgi:hypothetical protein